MSEFQPSLLRTCGELAEMFNVRADDYNEGTKFMYRILKDQIESRGGELPTLAPTIRSRLFLHYIDSTTEETRLSQLVDALQNGIQNDDPEAVRALEEVTKYRAGKTAYKFGALTVYTAFSKFSSAH